MGFDNVCGAIQLQRCIVQFIVRVGDEIGGNEVSTRSTIAPKEHFFLTWEKALFPLRKWFIKQDTSGLKEWTTVLYAVYNKHLSSILFELNFISWTNTTNLLAIYS